MLQFMIGFSIGNVMMYIDAEMIISFLICIITSLYMYISITPSRKFAQLMRVLNYICIPMIVISGICSYGYLYISYYLSLVILIPWHITNIIKLNKNKNTLQNTPIIHCNICGTALSGNIDFCTKCGSQVTNTEARGVNK